MFIVGLTGGIATGKSTVANVFRSHGVPVLDADAVARKIVEPGKKAWSLIREEFGSEVFDENGFLNREKLSDIVFNDETKRRKLNSITHPEIQKHLIWNTIWSFFKGHQFVVVDHPLLFETGKWVEWMHKIIVVTCEEDLQLQRLMERNSMSEAHATRRISIQMPLDKKCEMAHFVIENSGTIEDTQEQTKRIIVLLKHSRAHWKIRAITSLFFSGLLSLLFWLGYRFMYPLSRPSYPRKFTQHAIIYDVADSPYV